eukprot:9419665-Pyramimonas_sp.AAC.1
MDVRQDGLMLEEGAGLSAQGQQNLRVLAKGSLDYRGVAWALRHLDYGSGEQLLPGSSASRP